jgi:hypothetical protein
MDRPHLAAKPLQWKYRGGIADMAIRDMRLDGEEIHGGINYIGVPPFVAGMGFGKER